MHASRVCVCVCTREVPHTEVQQEEIFPFYVPRSGLSRHCQNAARTHTYTPKQHRTVLYVSEPPIGHDHVPTRTDHAPTRLLQVAPCALRPLALQSRLTRASPAPRHHPQTPARPPSAPPTVCNVWLLIKQVRHATARAPSTWRTPFRADRPPISSRSQRRS